MSPERAKADSRDPTGSPHLVTGRGAHSVPTCVCDLAHRGLSKCPGEPCPLVLYLKSKADYSTMEVEISFQKVDGKVSASGKVRASNSTLRKPKIRQIFTNRGSSFLPCESLQMFWLAGPGMFS